MIRKQWFLIALMIILAIGMGFAPALEPLTRVSWLKWTIVSITMFLIVWPFSFAAVTETLRNPRAAILATAINGIAMPLAVWPLALMIGGEVGAGMVVTFSAPCTVAAAAVWTRRGGGDERIAILVTLITNLFCFLTSPFWIWILLGSTGDSAVGFGDTAVKLLMFVVGPILVAQLVRLHVSSANWATREKKKLGIASQFGILSIVLLGSVQSGLRFRESETSLPIADLIVGVACLLLAHMVVLYSGRWLAEKFGMTRAEQIAVAIGGSQKTLMVGLSIAVSLQVTILPLLAFHSLQLVIDTVIVDRFVKQDAQAAKPPTE
jgi:sodium/bile acid cotransporter 7